MGNLRTLNLLAAFAFGAAGYVSCKLIDEIKEKNIRKPQSEQAKADGVKIDDIKDDYLKKLAQGIDENPINKGKANGILENGREMSIFLQRTSRIIYMNKKDAEKSNQIINQIADIANEDTYNDYKKVCFKCGDSGFVKNKLWPIFERMKNKFEADSDMGIETKNKGLNEIPESFEIDNKYSCEDIVRIFYPKLINQCGGSLVTAVFRFKYETGLDDETQIPAKITLPPVIDGCELNQNGFKRLRKLKIAA